MSAQSFINELIKHKHQTTIEFQQDWNIDNILKTVCAFLNSDGGWLIVGYNEKDNFAISEITDDAVNKLQQMLLDNIFPQPLVYIQLESIENKQLVLVNVVKGPRQPYSYNTKYYIRFGSTSKEADPDDISLMLRSANNFKSTWEKLTTIDAGYTDLDEALIQSTIALANNLSKANSLPQNPNDFLSYFQLIDYTSIKNGSLILFGKKPAKFLMQCRIRIINMPEGVTGDKFYDIEIIEDNLVVSFNKVIDYFKKHNPIISQFNQDNPLRIDREMYPFVALREAIVNAIVHRDYGDVSGEITINIHKEKIEIINSGEIPADIIKGKSIIDTHPSILRNPTIAHIFFLIGYMEKIGRGLSLIKQVFDELGHKSPEWTFQSGYTKLTLYGVAEVIKLNSRMKDFLVRMDSKKQYSREEYATFFDKEVKERTARNDLQNMIEGGWLQKIGDGPQTMYIRTNKKLPDFAG